MIIVLSVYDCVLKVEDPCVFVFVGSKAFWNAQFQ
jgi:hypothetical protein